MRLEIERIHGRFWVHDGTNLYGVYSSLHEAEKRLKQMEKRLG